MLPSFTIPLHKSNIHWVQISPVACIISATSPDNFGALCLFIFFSTALTLAILMQSADPSLTSSDQFAWFTNVYNTNTHPFNGPFSGTTQVSRYQKGKTNLFTEARDSEWQWHQLGHMQVFTSLQTDNHTSTPPLSFFKGRMPFLPPNQQRQSTEGNQSIIQSITQTYTQNPIAAITQISML